MKIVLHIERLVLDGLPVARSEGHIVRSAVERELTHLLATRDLHGELRAVGAVPALRGGNIRLGKRPQPVNLGKQIAGALHRGIGSKRKR